jgi:hypothetical protein
VDLLGVDRPTEADYKTARQLGTPYKVYENDISPFRIEVVKRIAALNDAAGLPGDWPVSAADRARIRTEVGTEFFRAEHGREPADARELAAGIAKRSRPKTNAVGDVADLVIATHPTFNLKDLALPTALADQVTRILTALPSSPASSGHCGTTRTPTG